VSDLVTGRLLLPLRDLGEGDDLGRSFPMKPFHIAFGNELWERKLPGLLPMVGEPPEFLWIQDRVEYALPWKPLLPLRTVLATYRCTRLSPQLQSSHIGERSGV
jgi:hypothetical protein